MGFGKGNMEKSRKQREKKSFFYSKIQYRIWKKREGKDSDFEYYIIMKGMRPENYSKTGNGTGWGISNFLNAIEKTNRRMKVANILVDNDAPLEKEAELVAKHVNKIKENEHCKKIHMLEISKCGTMSVALLKYLTESNLDKLDIKAYSAPYLGTIFASPVTLYNKIDEVINKVQTELIQKIIGHIKKIRPEPEEKEIKSSKLGDVLKKLHWNIFSQSHMDYDISEINGQGVPSQHKNRYDENYLKNMFDEKTLSMLRKVQFTNITTTCSEQTLKNAKATHNINAGMLYLADKIIFDKEPSDGMVPLKSEKYIEEVCEKNGINISKMRILDGHHDIGSDPRIIGEIINDRVLGKDEKENNLSIE